MARCVIQIESGNPSRSFWQAKISQRYNDDRDSNDAHRQAADWENLRARAARGPLEKLKRVLSKVNNVPADPADRL